MSQRGPARPARSAGDAGGGIQSMTGYGKAPLRSRRLSGTVEVRSFNHRYLKVALKVPSSLGSWETRIERTVRDRIARGSVNLTIRLDPGHRSAPYRFDPAVVEGYVKALRRLKSKFRLEGEPTLDLVASLPEALVALQPDEGLTESDWRGVRAGIETALDRLHEMRSAEGRKLARDVVRRQALITRKLASVKRLAPRVVRRYQKRLHERIHSLLQGAELPLDRADLAREVASFADRSDISEEIERLASHLQQFDRIVEDGRETGRRLEFILHEMFRESNTIGSKANDPAISHLVVEIKAEVEKIREQVQNIE